MKVVEPKTSWLQLLGYEDELIASIEQLVSLPIDAEATWFGTYEEVYRKVLLKEKKSQVETCVKIVI